MESGAREEAEGNGMTQRCTTSRDTHVSGIAWAPDYSWHGNVCKGPCWMWARSVIESRVSCTGTRRRGTEFWGGDCLARGKQTGAEGRETGGGEGVRALFGNLSLLLSHPSMFITPRGLSLGSVRSLHAVPWTSVSTSCVMISREPVNSKNVSRNLEISIDALARRHFSDRIRSTSDLPWWGSVCRMPHAPSVDSFANESPRLDLESTWIDA